MTALEIIASALSVLLGGYCAYLRMSRDDWRAKYKEERRYSIRRIAEMNKDRA